MSGKLSAVKNPLTIIAIFSGIAEISGTLVLPLVSSENQSLFICFLMFFPTYLVGLFFFTLHRKPSALYAPSDFSDEQNYMTTISALGIRVLKNKSETDPEVNIELTSCKNENKDVIEESVNDTSQSVTLDDSEILKVAGKYSEIALPELAKEFVEEKLKIKFDPDKAEMQNDLGYIKFLGAYYPPVIDESLSGDVILYDAKMYGSDVIEYLERVVSFTNETWKHFKNIQIIFSLVIREGQSVSRTDNYNIQMIQRKANFKLKVLYVFEKDLMKYKSGELN